MITLNFSFKNWQWGPPNSLLKPIQVEYHKLFGHVNVLCYDEIVTLFTNCGLKKIENNLFFFFF